MCKNKEMPKTLLGYPVKESHEAMQEKETVTFGATRIKVEIKIPLWVRLYIRLVIEVVVASEKLGMPVDADRAVSYLSKFMSDHTKIKIK